MVPLHSWCGLSYDSRGSGVQGCCVLMCVCDVWRKSGVLGCDVDVMICMGKGSGDLRRELLLLLLCLLVSVVVRECVCVC